MKPHFAHPSLKRLAWLEPLNARRLDERIYQEILAGGQDFSPATAEAHQPAIELLAELMNIPPALTTIPKRSKILVEIRGAL